MKVKKLNLKEIEQKFQIFSNQQAILIKGGDGDNEENQKDKDGDDDEDMEVVD